MISLLGQYPLLHLRFNIEDLSAKQCIKLFQILQGKESLETIDFGGPLQWSLHTNKNLNQRFVDFVSKMPNLESYQVVHMFGSIFSHGRAFEKGQVENKGGHERVTYVKRRK